MSILTLLHSAPSSSSGSPIGLLLTLTSTHQPAGTPVGLLLVITK